MIFAGQQITDTDVARAYKAVFSQFAGQVVACDILMHCGYFDEIKPSDMARAHYYRNFANWFLKRLGIIREDNLVNMIRHFMGQDEPVKREEDQKKSKEQKK